MYIVTTSKRIHQITAVVFLCLALFASFSIYRYYNAYSHQPEVLVDRLLRVVEQTAELSTSDYDFKKLQSEARLLTLSAIKADLERVGAPDAEAGARLLLPQATAFLEDPVQFQQWLSIELHTRTMPMQDLSIEKTALNRREVSSNDHCLVVERQEADWQLVSLLSC